MSGESGPEPLQILAVVADPAEARVIERTLEQTGDDGTVLADLAEGLARTEAESPDVVLVDVGLGGNAGLATIHHLRALAPQLVVIALATHATVELATQAVALGGTGLLVMPLSGDELMTLFSQVRERRAERAERQRLARQAQRWAAASELARRSAELSRARSRREAASEFSALCVEYLGAREVIVYLPVAEGSRQLMLSASRGSDTGAPAFCDDHAALGWAKQHDCEVLRLAIQAEQFGLVLIGGLPPWADGDEPIPLASLIASQLSLALALMGEREQSTRGAMKDPSSSAYTFAYFVDVAGREIDKARRYGRRFALATMCLDPASTAPASRDAASDPASGPHSGQTTSVYAAERVLGALRDTDVLARVDEHEFYLLLPETSGAGASVCRRRVLEHLGAPGGLARLSDGSGLDITLGVATYPHDGTDLSQLLRVARHRAERSAQSVVRRLGLARMNLDDALDALAWAADGEGADIDAPRSIELPALDLVGLAVSALNEARRGGKVRAVCTTRSGVSTGAALRAALGREDDGEVRLEVVDVSHLEGQRDLEVFGFIAEHASYVLAGRASRGVVRAVHASDPLLVDLLLARLGDLVGHRLGD